jgi:hypothetical protein
MAYVLVGTDNTGAYSLANTLYCPEAWQVDLTTVGGPIAYQLQKFDVTSPSSQGGSLWLPEEQLQTVTDTSGVIVPCTIAGMARRCTGVRIRSLTAGTSVSFQAVLIPPSELSPDSVVAGTVSNVNRYGGLYPDPLPAI